MQQPLAFLLRPTTIADIIGQSHIINDQNSLISRMLKYNYASSLIFMVILVLKKLVLLVP